MEASIFLTYRCNAKCKMCDTWNNPSNPDDEIKPEILNKFPKMSFINFAGGEPFVRDDVEEFVKIGTKISDRVVFSTNGFLTDRIIDIAKKYPIGIRISVDGLPKCHDETRGIQHAFDKSIRTLIKLKEVGCKDIGFSMCVSDWNYKDLVDLYSLINSMGMEFATASVHNSFYFHKSDNSFKNPEAIAEEFEKLSQVMLKSKRPKDWFRAWFNHGMANRVLGNKRIIPCECGTESFRLNPFGEIIPCEGSCNQMTMGNLKTQSFDEIWNSKESNKIREAIKNCNRHCWFVGNVIPTMRKNISVPIRWIIKNKFF